MVGGVETLFFERFATEGPDDPDAGQLFAQDAVDGVDALLHAAEDRQHPRHDEEVAHRQHRNTDRQQPGQPGILMDRHGDAPDTHDRRGHQDGCGHLDEDLDLADVVGGAGQQRRRSEAGGLGLGKRDDVAEHSRAQIAAEPHAGAGTEVHRADRDDSLQGGHRQHHQAKPEDQCCVARRDAVIDDGRVDGRQVERGQRTEGLQDHHRHHRPPVWPQIAAHQCQQHVATVPHPPDGQTAVQPVCRAFVARLPLQCML